MAERLSRSQRAVLRLLVDHETRLGRALDAGDAGVYTVTWSDTYTVGVHWRTAEALARRGLVIIGPSPGYGEPADLFLTDAGREASRG